MGQELDCPFCSRQEGEKVLASELCYARWNKYPVTEGHLLIVPNRHVADYFSVTAEEKTALWAMVDEAKKLLDERVSATEKPAGTITSTNTDFPKIGRYHQSTRRCARRDSGQGRLFENRKSAALKNVEV